MNTASVVPFRRNDGCYICVREVYRSVTQLRRIRGDLFLESLWLAQQLLVVGGPPTLCADVAGVAHELLVKREVRFQHLLHFAKRLGHRRRTPENSLY
jgi:hypothetical protein